MELQSFRGKKTSILSGFVFKLLVFSMESNFMQGYFSVNIESTQSTLRIFGLSYRCTAEPFHSKKKKIE